MKIPTKNPFQNFNWLDGQRIGFIVAFLVGAIGTISLKENGVPAVYSIALFFFVVLAYIIYCSHSAGLIHPEILGDNIYYLGFLLTLVSLSYTLYKFSSADNEIDQIIENFGIALSSTLIGVVGRVYFNQTHDDGDQISTLSTPALDERLGQELVLRQELIAQAKVLAHESSLLSASLTESTHHLHQKVQETALALKELTESLQSNSKELALCFDESNKMYAKSHELNLHIQADSKTTVEAIRSLRQGLGSADDHSSSEMGNTTGKRAAK